MISAPAFASFTNPAIPSFWPMPGIVGSARMLAALGAKAIASSSAAHAFTIGLGDQGEVSRDQALAHAEDLVAATPLPVSGDFENGYGDAPKDVAETVRLAGEVGLAGVSIEDLAYPAMAPYDQALAVERIRAAVSAARALPRDFVLTARADGVMEGLYDVDEGLARLLAFEEAGADCLFMPMPPRVDDLTRVIGAVKTPVNVLAAGRFSKVSVAEYAQMGAARLSIGAALARVTHAVIDRIGTEMLSGGSFAGLQDAAPGDRIGRPADQGKLGPGIAPGTPAKA